jgi:hypothetical protein
MTQPISLQNPPQAFVHTTHAEVTNGTSGTYYYYLDMSGYQHFAIQYALNGGTGGGGSGVVMTVEGSTQNVAQESATYKDVTMTLFGAATFSAADTASTDGWLVEDTATAGGFSWVRIKIVAAPGDANTGDWSLYSKRWY